MVTFTIGTNRLDRTVPERIEKSCNPESRSGDHTQLQSVAADFSCYEWASTTRVSCANELNSTVSNERPRGRVRVSSSKVARTPDGGQSILELSENTVVCGREPTAT